MKHWSKHPVVYEINSWVWLRELSQKYGRLVNFRTVPREAWDAIASLGFDAVWFMGPTAAVSCGIPPPVSWG